MTHNADQGRQGFGPGGSGPTAPGIASESTVATLEAKRERLAQASTPDLRLMLAGLTYTDVIRRGGHDYTYDEIMEEMSTR